MDERKQSAFVNRKESSLLVLSTKAEYSLLALIELADRYLVAEPITMNEIAKKQPIPERYLEQICTILRRGGLIQSFRGAKGGYLLARDPWQITVLEVVELVEGERLQRDSVEDSTIERDLIYEVWREAKLVAEDILRNVTLQELWQRRDQYRQDSPMYYI
ncbi:Rrf2 family transcriptional regulator [Alkalinema sp. FACHB-956]|uniref:Rrf2 family transcriptional regulator n=1 Tax=Alkalinema sp. FACHB-956 TaxID=2692768 RepID=UPI0016885D3F|nr:Rrf2 family transcriptional regulator [Alkalinema sp. FACHB-956]